MNQEIPLNEKIRILSRLVSDIIDRNNIMKVSDHQISQNQFLILKILFASGSKKVSELADLLEISRAAASKNVDYLVKKKLVGRKTVSKDRRSMLNYLLNSGKDFVTKYNNQSDDKINTILSYFSDEEQKLFNQILDKYIHYLIEGEDHLQLFCLQCGGKFEGMCPVGEYHNKCYFHLTQKDIIS